MSEKKEKKSTGILRKLLIIIPIIAIIYSLFNIYTMLKEDWHAANINTELIESVNHDKDGLIVLSKEEFNQLKSKNQDFVGWISFESGIINEPVVQAADNDYYLRRDFYGEYLELGTVFMDYSHTLESQNMTFYGHNVFRNDDSMFSPLLRLADYDNYDDNKNFTFSDGEHQRDYAVSKIFYHSTTNDTNINYMIGDYYSQDEFLNYINVITQRQLYDTGVVIGANDKTITLQTCVEGDPDARLIVIGKEINREPLKDK